MKITLNNRKEIIEAEAMTMNELIRYKNFTFKFLVTKLNGQLVKTADRDQAIVRNGDKIEVLHLITGG